MHYSVLAERATYFKKNEKGREEMSEVMKRFAEQIALQQKIEFAKKLLSKGMSVEFTADSTELPIQEVQKLAEQRSA